MIQDLIKRLNNILTKGNVILHIELSNTPVKAIQKVTYTLYIHCNASEHPIKILCFSRTLNIGHSINELDNEATEELLKFIIRGELATYE